MKQIALVAVALVLGLVLGGLGPRRDVRTLEERIATMEKESRRRSSVGSDLAALMAGGNRPAPSPRTPPRTNPLGDRDPAALAAENPEAAELAARIDADQENVGGEIADELNKGISDEQLEVARTALELRRAQARASLMEDARPDEVQMETIDGAVTAMNDTLIDMADEMVAMLESGQEPTRREAMEFAADALDTMLLAEDRMRSALDADQLAEVEDGALDPFSYVSPRLVELFADLGAAEE
jgi:hypothetical protein